ncbi:BZ3500_MvSof-1268-A1-R1_Chr9g10776 [Microbotryum saponariae]|uniref:BZ3500_MvSof-1268-A1-R1_Chr9g10776 protein n=1 Tax=Microbotryum saponariae TaxID=289078 RepID=A0A2X0L3T1_9BASI|nr:BZ3501_MvSof-1269-A2-R1_Chr9g10524 [Microbotryum saponariae]SDA00669.1 BZ3500_MvSof-1268-A1-R1_Chr9g10776 [Microbotryum saponariae]
MLPTSTGSLHTSSAGPRFRLPSTLTKSSSSSSSSSAANSTRSSLLHSAGTAPSSSPSSALNDMKILLRRLSRYPQMDFEMAGWTLLHVCIAPRRVYRNVYYHKQTKNTWARDDPAVPLLISACLFLAAILWSVLYARYDFFTTLRTIFSMVAIHFFLVGVVISTVLWAASNKFLTHTSHTHATDQHVEWPYAFDVHANAFFPLFLQLYVAQLLLAPVVTRSNWVCLWVGNTLYLSALTQYAYVTCEQRIDLGYNALPFLIRSELLLFPVAIFFAFYVVSLLGFNIAKTVLGAMFGKVVVVAAGAGTIP